MKKFFKKTEGFTLVELIVVIAILGILAGVGTVGYSGYIKKAQIAADNQLLAAINQAYAAACIENGVDASKTTASNITIGTDKTISKDDIVVSDPAAKAADIQGDFEKYFAGNESATFKTADTLTFANGMFYLPGSTIEQLKSYLAASSFNGNLGVVTTQVDKLTSALSTYLGTNFASLAGGGFSTYLTELGIGDTEYDKQSEAAILYLAQNAADMDDTDIANATTAMNELLEVILIGEGDQMDYIDKLTEQTGSNLASYAALYAVAEGIALQQGEGSAAYEALHGDDVELTDATSVLSAGGSVLGSLSDEETAAYLIDSTGSDMTAYFKALQAVSNSQEELETEVKNGNSVINSTAIQNLIAQVG